MHRPPPLRVRRSEQGMALVVALLILLAQRHSRNSPAMASSLIFPASRFNTSAILGALASSSIRTTGAAK